MILDRVRSFFRGPVLQPTVPPKFPESKPPIDRTALEWARRVIERVKDATFSGRLHWPAWQDDTTEETDQIRKDYDLMMAEPMIVTGLRVLFDAVASLDLQVIPENLDNPREAEQAEFVRYLFTHVKGGVLRVVRTVLLNGARCKWSVSEKVWERVTEGRWAGKWRWKAWKAKDVKNLYPVVDQFRNLTGIRPRHSPRPDTIYDPDDFVIYTHFSLLDSPEGMSLLRAAHRDWWNKKVAVELWGLNLEKWGSPFLVGTYSDKDLQLTALETALSEAKGNTWITVPQGAAVQPIAASAGAPATFEAFIAARDKGMLISIMGSHLPVLEGANQNVAGSSREQRNTTELFQWAYATEASLIFTEQAAQACRINYGDVPPPTVVLGSVSETEIATMLANDEALHRIGVPLSIASIRTRASREGPRDEGDTLAPAGGPPEPDAGLGFFGPGQSGNGFSDWDEYCGGKGGKPGPCPKGAKKVPKGAAPAGGAPPVAAAPAAAPPPANVPERAPAPQPAPDPPAPAPKEFQPDTVVRGTSRSKIKPPGNDTNKTNFLGPERQAIFAYSGDAEFGNLNASLRGGQSPAGELSATHQGLQAAFQRIQPLKTPVVAYRGLSLPKDQADALIAKFQPGKELTINGYTSTSLDPKVGAAFAKNDSDVVMEIKAKKGIDLSQFSQYKNEKEFLINHADRYRVVGVKTLNYKMADGKTAQRRTIQMEQL